MLYVKIRSLSAGVFALAAVLAGPAAAQVVEVDVRAFASNVVIPQSRAIDVGHSGAVEITGVDVEVAILGQAATTTMDIGLRNPTHRRLEAELVVPVPDGAVVKGFAFQGSAAEPKAEVLPKDDTRRTYESLVAKMRDPALLEFYGCNLIRSSVFPVEAGGTQKVRLVYEHILTADGGRVDYVLPRSESIDYSVPWRISVDIKSKKPVSTAYSPSHRLETKRDGENHLTVRIADDAAREPGAFRLSYVIEEDGVSATFFAYPDPRVSGGYFLLLAGLPAAPAAKDSGADIKRDVTLVFDRSGSMHGEKIEQVREAALQVISGLRDGETFNIIAYNDGIGSFSKDPVAAGRDGARSAERYLDGVSAVGGTNIYDALSEALGRRPPKGSLPIVLFLTDGQPTVGNTSEIAIRDVADKANVYEKRIFTFGVGVDVNAPLLDKIASQSRATSTYVLPKENVEAKVGQVFKRLSGPVLASPSLDIASGEPGRARDIIPSTIPDLFEGEQLVVLGQYTGSEPLEFILSGNFRGARRTFRFTLDPERARTANSFVPRLWASRRIAVLVDAIRQLGADNTRVTASRRGRGDPKVKELVDEVVRLSTEFGILTEYTAFLAREGTNLSDRTAVREVASANVVNRAMMTRDGMGAANQARNIAYQHEQQSLNVRNEFYDENMQRVSVAAVQQVGNGAFYSRKGRWVDSRVVENEDKARPDRVVEFGSDDWRKLAARLAAEDRQGSLALRGDILMMVDGQLVLVKNEVTK